MRGKRMAMQEDGSRSAEAGIFHSTKQQSNYPTLCLSHNVTSSRQATKSSQIWYDRWEPRLLLVVMGDQGYLRGSVRESQD